MWPSGCFGCGRASPWHHLASMVLVMASDPRLSTQGHWYPELLPGEFLSATLLSPVTVLYALPLCPPFKAALVQHALLETMRTAHIY